MSQLMIVESAAKARTIQNYLGDGWRVMACMGHVRDLPVKALGVDVDADFRPTYAVLAGKAKLVKQLVQAIRAATSIYVATDPDREGEAIAWHLLQLADIAADKRVYRVTFNAITEPAVKAALAQPRPLDRHLIEAQATRRIVDRLVGYLASPLACKALDGRFSAGRVQSACLRLIVERERAIRAFQPQTYHTLALKLNAPAGELMVDLHRIKGADTHFTDRARLDKLVRLLRGAQLRVADIKHQPVTVKPPQPFTTSTLQQVASRALNLSPDRVMDIAQGLYEAGLITYHRTDGLSVAPEARQAARAFIDLRYGTDYLPPTPPKQGTGEAAHEAIRPADVRRCADPVKPTQSAEAEKLYALIWRRFIASRMTGARFTLTTITVTACDSAGKQYPLAFRAARRERVFDGFQRVYDEPDGDDPETVEAVRLPELTVDQPLAWGEALVADKQTRAPQRFSEAGLVAELERVGVGRPSTYAGMVRAVQDKGYVKLQARRLVPTASGERLLDYLTAHFALVFAVDYTARLEAELDQVAAGERTRLAVLRGFWAIFQPRLAVAASDLPAERRAPQPTGEDCPQCGAELLVRQGAKEAFIGCSAFPNCTYTRSLDAKPLLLHPASGGDG